jgi:glucose-6-phosphate 1-dehydrogenase
VDAFLQRCEYVQGSYGGDGEEIEEGFRALHEWLRVREARYQMAAGRLFYLALPPQLYPMVAHQVGRGLMCLT